MAAVLGIRSFARTAICALHSGHICSTASERIALPQKSPVFGPVIFLVRAMATPSQNANAVCVLRGRGMRRAEKDACVLDMLHRPDYTESESRARAICPRIFRRKWFFDLGFLFCSPIPASGEVSLIFIRAGIEFGHNAKNWNVQTQKMGIFGGVSGNGRRGVRPRCGRWMHLLIDFFHLFLHNTSGEARG